MSLVDALGSGSAATAARAAAASDPTRGFGQDQFLTLMLAQLKNQDPLKPLEPSEFLGQLAQFSTVTGIQGMQKTLGGLADASRASQVLEGAALVGRDVLTAGSSARLAGGSPVHGAVEVPPGATSVELAIRDASGTLVRRLQVPASEGSVAFSWNGQTDGGDLAPAGSYRFEAVARIGGRAESLPLLLSRRVESVSIDAAGGGLTLNTASGTVSLGNVRRVM